MKTDMHGEVCEMVRDAYFPSCKFHDLFFRWVCLADTMTDIMIEGEFLDDFCINAFKHCVES